MLLIPQKDYADMLAKKGLLEAATQQVEDEQVFGGVKQTIQALLKLASNTPNGPRVEATRITLEKDQAGPENVCSRIQTIHAAQTAGSISIVLCGESHTTADDRDTKRARSLIQEMSEHGGTIQPTLVVFERGMDRKYPHRLLTAPAREDVLTYTTARKQLGWGLRPKQRSMVVAGYIFLLLAGGDQNDIDKVVLIYGEEHRDIFDYFEQFARETTADWIQNRPRTLLMIESHV